MDLVPQYQILTIDLFHGKSLAGLLVADQIHSPVKNHQTFGQNKQQKHFKRTIYAGNMGSAGWEEFTIGKDNCTVNNYIMI